MKRTKYVVAWMFNGRTYSEEFEFMTLAQLRMIQLEGFGLQPSLHEKK